MADNITDADREAAAELAEKLGECIFLGGNDLAAIRNGTWDNDTESGDVLSHLVPAFTKHRQSQLAERDAEIERLRDYAREVSKAFTAISGGGSEMFIRIGEDFYADPKACRERVESKIATMRKHMRPFYPEQTVSQPSQPNGDADA